MRSLALWRAVGLAVLLAVVALVPLDGNIVLTQVGVLVLLYVGSAVAWNIFSGFTGYISLGAAVFFGVGVYTVALFTKHLNLVGGVVFALYPVGGLVAAAVAVPFGLVALRVRRHTFVVVTIAVFFIFQLMAYNFSWTGGAAGLIPQFLNWDQATVAPTYSSTSTPTWVTTTLLPSGTSATTASSTARPAARQMTAGLIAPSPPCGRTGPGAGTRARARAPRRTPPWTIRGSSTRPPATRA